MFHGKWTMKGLSKLSQCTSLKIHLIDEGVQLNSFQLTMLTLISLINMTELYTQTNQLHGGQFSGLDDVEPSGKYVKSHQKIKV